MGLEHLDQRLSKISTIWTILRQAQAGPPDTAVAAQQALLQRYGGAVRRYLLGMLRDADAADELTQEFGLALVRGDFRQFDPQRGRFRAYLKGVLFHLVCSFRRQEQRLPRPLAGDNPAWEGLVAPAADAGVQFDADWRAELLARAWDTLQQSQPTFYAVLRFRADHREMTSEEMAAELGRQMGRPWTAAAVRQTLRRAREKFADVLLDEVAHSLQTPTAETVAEELIELNLLEYCRPALDRLFSRQGEGPPPGPKGPA